MLKINKIHQGDCLELINRIDENSIDLIFLDPPYNLQLNKELTRPNHSVVTGVSQDWDKFDNYASYDEFTLSYLKNCKRILSFPEHIGKFQTLLSCLSSLLVFRVW